jgi:hypothetical protein
MHKHLYKVTCCGILFYQLGYADLNQTVGTFSDLYTAINLANQAGSTQTQRLQL